MRKHFLQTLQPKVQTSGSDFAWPCPALDTRHVSRPQVAQVGRGQVASGATCEGFGGSANKRRVQLKLVPRWFGVDPSAHCWAEAKLEWVGSLGQDRPAMFKHGNQDVQDSLADHLQLRVSLRRSLLFYLKLVCSTPQEAIFRDPSTRSSSHLHGDADVLTDTWGLAKLSTRSF